MKRLHLTLLVLGLLATSLTLVVYKVNVLGFPLKPAQTVDNWVVEARVAFEPSGGALTARLALPDEPPGFGILDENFISRGYGLTTTQQGENREAQWTTRTPSGRQVLYYRATVYELNRERPAPPTPARCRSPTTTNPTAPPPWPCWTACAIVPPTSPASPRCW